MSKRRNYRLRFVGAISLVALAICFALLNRGQSADETPAPAAAAKPDPKFMGAASCALCHSKSDRPQVKSDLVTLEEYSIWDHGDRHRHAFDVLDCPRAHAMETALGWERDSAKTNSQCLACHSIEINKDSAGETLSDAKAQTAAIAQGVSCEACHGAAHDWIDLHWKGARWRELPPQQKAKYGLTDLCDPITRTELCLSCHLGNVSEKKFVTHDMFAAGHPPLAAFEIATFLEQMPPHWQPKKAAPMPPSVAIEGLVMQQASVHLLASAASDPQYADDFALYDCSACHHELQTPSQRQERGYADDPGRLPPRSADSPLAQAARNLQAAPDSPNQLLKQLCRVGQKSTLDFEGAWQLTGAIRAAAADDSGLADAVSKLSQLASDYLAVARDTDAKFVGCGSPGAAMPNRIAGKTTLSARRWIRRHKIPRSTQR